MDDFDTKDVVTSAVLKELREGEYILGRFQRKLKTFEEKYDMKTEEFVKKFESGELDDREDFFEWRSLCKGVEYWERKTRNLERAT